MKAIEKRPERNRDVIDILVQSPAELDIQDGVSQSNDIACGVTSIMFTPFFHLTKFSVLYPQLSHTLFYVFTCVCVYVVVYGRL